MLLIRGQREFLVIVTVQKYNAYRLNLFLKLQQISGKVDVVERLKGFVFAYIRRKILIVVLNLPIQKFFVLIWPR